MSAYSDDNVIQLPPRKPRVVAENPAPREKFGLRKPWLHADNLADLSKAGDARELATKSPKRKSLSALADLAREYGGDANYIDPQLRAILAAQIEGAATTVAHLANIARSYKMFAECAELCGASGDLEIISAHIAAKDVQNV